MKTLTFPGCSQASLKASCTDSYPVPARQTSSLRRSGAAAVQLQEKALRSVKHRHQTKIQCHLSEEHCEPLLFRAAFHLVINQSGSSPHQGIKFDHVPIH